MQYETETQYQECNVHQGPLNANFLHSKKFVRYNNV